MNGRLCFCFEVGRARAMELVAMASGVCDQGTPLAAEAEGRNSTNLTAMRKRRRGSG